MRILILFFISTLNVSCFAQNITGTWLGNYGKKFGMINPEKLVVEIFISNDSIVTGASHLYYKNNKYEHYTIKGKFYKKDSTIQFVEDSTIAVKLGFMSSNCLGKYEMKLSVSDSFQRLEGRWKDKRKGLLKCPSSSVWLTKKIDIKKDTAKSIVPIVKNARTDEIQSLIEVKLKDADLIKVEVYDNGEIDNDTVSVFYNDELIVNKKLITTKPIAFNLKLSKEDPIAKLKIIAESVGSIPPCTALLIITTKSKRYEVNLKSDFYKNGIVEFFLKE
jgi:hypothetical protein